MASSGGAKGGSVPTPANNAGGFSAGDANRRGSGGNSGTLFSGLMSQKRNSGDAAAQARRQSFSDQKPAAGVIGNMWNKFTTGGHK